MLEAFATMASSVTWRRLACDEPGREEYRTNQEKLRNAWVAMTAALTENRAARVARLRGLLGRREEDGDAQGGRRACRSVCRDRPDMAAPLSRLPKLLDSRDGHDRAVVTNVAREAYRTHLESYHNFWLKEHLPSGLGRDALRGDFIQRLGIHPRRA